MTRRHRSRASYRRIALLALTLSSLTASRASAQSRPDVPDVARWMLPAWIGAGAAAVVISPSAASALHHNVDGTFVLQEEWAFALYVQHGPHVMPRAREECAEYGCFPIDRTWVFTTRIHTTFSADAEGVGAGRWIGGGLDAGATDRHWTLIGIASLLGSDNATNAEWALTVGPRIEWETLFALEVDYQHVQLRSYETNGVRALLMANLTTLIGFAFGLHLFPSSRRNTDHASAQRFPERVRHF